jgi:predicted DNA-binding transcriptional regulator AlpA
MVTTVSNGIEPSGPRLIYFEDLEPKKGIKLSEMTIWRMMKAGTFPKNVLVGQRKAWRESVIDAWIAKLPTGKGRTPPKKNAAQ